MSVSKEAELVVKQYLDEIENTRGIKVLYAVESGSRAWGFHSKDSDFDIRFFYVERPEWYMRVSKVRDCLENMDHPFDYSGWELRKTLGLLMKSNPSLLEWLKSPIVYREIGDVADRMRIMVASWFNPIPATYHYLHMAEGNYRRYLQDREMVHIKKYLYVVRPLLACQYILKHLKMPPTLMTDMEEELDNMPQDAHHVLVKLLQEKMDGVELGERKSEPTLNKWVEDQLQYFYDHKPPGPKDRFDLNELNELLYYTVMDNALGKF